MQMFMVHIQVWTRISIIRTDSPIKLLSPSGILTGHCISLNKEVTFTNNLAERDTRPVKVKQKISNWFRTFTGVEIYTRIDGFISTTRKHNQNVFSEVGTTFKGYHFLTIPR